MAVPANCAQLTGCATGVVATGGTGLASLGGESFPLPPHPESAKATSVVPPSWQTTFQSFMVSPQCDLMVGCSAPIRRPALVDATQRDA